MSALANNAALIHDDDLVGILDAGDALAVFNDRQEGLFELHVIVGVVLDPVVAELARGIDLQVWTSYYGLKTAEQKIRTAGDLHESARASYDVALGRYKEGVGSLLDLLAAESVLENARVELVQAKSEWFLALVQFTHDTGALEPPSPPGKSPLPSGSEKGDHRP